MLVCGSCKGESHISCVASPGLARLLNPFICSTCITFSDRPGGIGGGLASSSRDRSASLASSLGSFESPVFDSDPMTPSTSVASRSYRSSNSASPSTPLSGRFVQTPLPPLSPTYTGGTVGSIVNPDQKVFEDRAQFTMWAKSMFIMSPNKNAPMELKNT